MSRFAHHHPEDWQDRMDALVDRADAERTRQKEAATPAPLPTIPAETLDELRWLSNSALAIAVVDKPVLRLLLDSWERENAFDAARAALARAQESGL